MGPLVHGAAHGCRRCKRSSKVILHLLSGGSAALPDIPFGQQQEKVRETPYAIFIDDERRRVIRCLSIDDIGDISD